MPCCVRKKLFFYISSYWILAVLCTNSTNKRTIEDEYYYDYELSASTSLGNGSTNSDAGSGGFVPAQSQQRQRLPTEPLLLPNPDPHHTIQLLYTDTASSTIDGTKERQREIDIIDAPDIIGDISTNAKISSGYDLATGPADMADMVFDSAGPMVDVLPVVELPDDSLADSDLRDHDFIDNLMYVYYGPTSNGQRMSSSVQLSSAGALKRTYEPEVMVIGAVVSCAAQLMTIFVILLRRHNSRSAGTGNGTGDSQGTNGMLLHMVMSMCLANLIFMLGVHASRNHMKCQIIALFLHYLHLMTTTWIFVYGYYIYKKFCKVNLMKDNLLIGLTYSIPALFTLVAFMGAPHHYETRRFCFLSVQRGMIIQYMVPVTALIVATTLYTLNGIRILNLELAKLELNSSVESLTALRHELEQHHHYQQQIGGTADGEIISLREGKRCLKTVCVLEMCYCVMWFEAVLALESGGSDGAYTMAVVYSATSLLMNWYIFCRTKTLLPSIAARLSLVDDCVANTNTTSVTGLANVTPGAIYDHNTTVEKALASNRRQLALVAAARGSSDSIPLLVSVQGCASAETELHEIARPEYISTISS